MSFPEQPFGFVAGRWVRSIGDTPDDADRAPDYIPVETGKVLFTPQVTHRVAPDTTGWAGIIKERIPARLGERGQLIDAEGHDHLALAAGVYSVSYDFGTGRSWPSHYIEVRTDHTSSSPLWLPPIAPPPVGPMIENRVVTLPEGGRNGQVLVWDGAAFSWDYPPTGPQGPKGDLDAEQLAGAPRLTNLVHYTTWTPDSRATIDSQSDGLTKFTVTTQFGYIRKNFGLHPGSVYYYSVEVKATSDQVYSGSYASPAFHSGSGDWERLSGSITTASGVLYLEVRDRRESGWDPIEVRDAVVIDLTEVFGAGREPTKEYMDDLLAKHGGYIGAVDQFAFGDALQALTVAGPGMTLRRDNSVGERIFLDYPGGSTMLHGDTGWRNISSLLTFDTTYLNVEGSPSPSLRVKRVNGTVWWRLEARIKSGGLPTNIVSLVSGIPTGLRVDVLRDVLLDGSNMSGVLGMVTGSGSSITGKVWSGAGSLLWGSGTWPTADSWPTTLPGTPL